MLFFGCCPLVFAGVDVLYVLLKMLSCEVLSGSGAAEFGGPIVVECLCSLLCGGGVGAVVRCDV